MKVWGAFIVCCAILALSGCDKSRDEEAATLERERALMRNCPDCVPAPKPMSDSATAQVAPKTENRVQAAPAQQVAPVTSVVSQPVRSSYSSSSRDTFRARSSEINIED